MWIDNLIRAKAAITKTTERASLVTTFAVRYVCRMSVGVVGVGSCVVRMTRAAALGVWLSVTTTAAKVL